MMKPTKIVAALATAVAIAATGGITAGVAFAATKTCAGFSDVAADSAFCDAISWMATNKITLGYEDGTFGPGKPVTRAAMAAFMQRLYTTVKKDIDVEAASGKEGPAGPAGPAGAPGPQGPAGVGGVSVVDTDGAILGSLVDASSHGFAAVDLITPTGYLITLDWSGVFWPGASIAYTTADCTGTPYLLGVEEPGTGLAETVYAKLVVYSATQDSLWAPKLEEGSVSPQSEVVFAQSGDDSSLANLGGCEARVPGMWDASNERVIPLVPVTSAQIGLPDDIKGPLTLQNN